VQAEYERDLHRHRHDSVVNSSWIESPLLDSFEGRPRKRRRSALRRPKTAVRRSCLDKRRSGRLLCLQSARDLREQRAHHLRRQLAGIRVLSARVVAADQYLSVGQLVERAVCEPWPRPKLDAA
jgi:hypothetical protein